MKRQRFYCLKYFAQSTDIHLSGKSAKLHDWSTMGSQLLVQWTTSYFLSYQDCHLFQQHFVFRIEINGSVKLFQKIGTIIRSSDGSKCWACMRETDADKFWQAGHGKPWTNIRNFSDEMDEEDPTQGILDELQPFTVHLEDLETCARTFLWKSDLRFGRWCFKSGDIQIEAQYSYSLPLVPKEIYSTNWRDWWLENSRAQKWISEQSPVRCRDTRSLHWVDTTRAKTKTSQETEKIFCKFSEPSH